MRAGVLAFLLCSSALATAPALAQPSTSPANAQASASHPTTGPADLCQELLAYAEKKAAEPPKSASNQQPPGSAAAPPPRVDRESSGTQGGGSVDRSASADTRTQAAAPPTTPVSPGAASEPATSPHATDASSQATGASPTGAPVPPAEFKLSGGITVEQVRETTKRGDRQACRDTAQTLRRAGADLPAALIALAAYEPDPAKRK